ncbi:MAG: glycosyltransferase family 88 protein, partial [Legionella sp.]|nr:glycosyltransferase family 88 protein [Legionella sp.]
MTYTFNPHRHVKIWLSKDEDVFLNQENQLRLVRMRHKNPNDEIQLLYAEKLLSSNAITALNAFCEKHNIQPVSIEAHILPNCLDTESEQNLIGLYQREVNALNAGGNVAAASDILRWMSPV